MDNIILSMFTKHILCQARNEHATATEGFFSHTEAPCGSMDAWLSSLIFLNKAINCVTQQWLSWEPLRTVWWITRGAHRLSEPVQSVSFCGLVVIQSLDKSTLIPSSHNSDQKVLKDWEREQSGNSSGGEGGKRVLPWQLVTQWQAHHRNTLMSHHSYYSIFPLPHRVRLRAVLSHKNQKGD